MDAFGLAPGRRDDGSPAAFCGESGPVARGPRLPRSRTQCQRKEQTQRFIKKAREIEVDETGEPFERAVGVILAPKHPIPRHEPNEDAKPRRKL